MDPEATSAAVPRLFDALAGDTPPMPMMADRPSQNSHGRMMSSWCYQVVSAYGMNENPS
jgi:hypothetical protein